MLKKLFKHLNKAFLEEIHSLFLFIPVLMGIGAMIYLKLFFQFFSPIPFISLSILAIISIALRKRHYINLISISLLCLNLGFSSALLDSYNHHTDMLVGGNIKHYVEGEVDQVIPKNKGISIIVKLNHESLSDIDGNKLSGIKKVSVKLTSKSETPHIGDTVYVKAMLNSPTPSVMKGAYDFRKDAYFKEIGAFGYATTKLYFLERAGISVSDKFKKSVSTNIDLHAENENNAQLIKALMLGEKKAVSKETVSIFRASGISHLLSISGLHIGLIFGFIFLLIRYLLALNQTLTLRFNVKKFCASIAIIITLMYVLLVGYPMPTIRAFIMMFIVYLGIIFDRRAISMRNVAIAGIIILLFAPHSILSASFQMSFSAVIALVTAYEYISAKSISMHGFRGYLIGIIFTSFIAILATTPFAIYNFQNFSPYGILTNTAVMPIIGSITMPFIVLTHIAMPLGLAAIPLTVLDKSISWTLDIATYVSNISNSSMLISPTPAISMALFIFTGLFLCLFKHKLRAIGAVLLTLSIITAFTHKDQPDIIISPNADIIAVRNQDGLFTFSDIGKDTFVSDIIRKINGQSELLPFSDNSLIQCDDTECLYTKDNVTINVNELDGKPYAQQMYINNKDVVTLNLK